MNITTRSSTRQTRFVRSISTALVAVAFVGSFAYAQQGTLGADGCIPAGTFDTNADYFANKTQVDNATLFNVTYNKSYKVVKNTDPLVNLQYVLTLCGAPAPVTGNFPNNTRFFTIPIQSVATLSTTPLAYLEMLGVRSVIKETDTEGLATSPCIMDELAKSTLVALNDGNVTLRASQLNGTQLIFSDIGDEAGSENRTVQTSEVSDPGALNRAEWLEFYATFFNLESTAQNLTASINNNYNCFKNAANSVSTKPVVAWASYNAPSTFNNNTASWTLSGAAYKQKLTLDAGGTFYNGTTNSTFGSASDFASAVANVDVLIDETFVANDIATVLSNYGLNSSSTLKFVVNQKIFREDGTVNANDGRDWFENAVVMADAVVQDLVRAIHPEVLPSDIGFNWIRNVAKSEVQKTLSATDCKGTGPLADVAITCATMKVGTAGSSAFKINSNSKVAMTLAVVVMAMLI